MWANKSIRRAIYGQLLWAATGFFVIFVWICPVQAQEGGETLLRVAAMGDIMMGTENLLPADGGESLFTAVKPYLDGRDVVFGNIEGPLTDRGKATKVTTSGKSYCFRTPPSYGKWLRAAGFNMVSIANNHTNDYGPEGKEQTIVTLELNGIAWSGPPGPPATRARRTLKGLKVALIAYHTSSHCNWVNDVPLAKKTVAGLAAENNIVIVSFHGGAEGAKAIHVPNGPEKFYGENRGDLRVFSRAVIDAGADLVIGHGPHVPRAMEVYQKRLIAYSLGNFCTGKGINVRGVTGLAPLLLVDLKPNGELAGGEIVSFLQTFGQPPKPDNQNRAAKLIHQLGVEDFPASNAVTEDGRVVHP